MLSECLGITGGAPQGSPFQRAAATAWAARVLVARKLLFHKRLGAPGDAGRCTARPQPSRPGIRVCSACQLACARQRGASAIWIAIVSRNCTLLTSHLLRPSSNGAGQENWQCNCNSKSGGGGGGGCVEGPACWQHTGPGAGGRTGRHRQLSGSPAAAAPQVACRRRNHRPTSQVRRHLRHCLRTSSLAHW